MATAPRWVYLGKTWHRDVGWVPAYELTDRPVRQSDYAKRMVRKHLKELKGGR